MPDPTPRFGSFNQRRSANAGGGAVPSVRSDAGRANFTQAFWDMIGEFTANPNGVSGGDLAGGLANARFSGKRGDASDQARNSMNAALQAALAKAFQLEGVENKRFADSFDFMKSEFAASNAGFEKDNARQDRLMFSGKSDQFGREAADGLNSLRTGIGARGINPNSGAAASMAGSLALRQTGQLMGAKRDITIDSLRRRDAHRIQRFQQAFGIAEFGNQGDSEIGLQALGSLTSLRERGLDRELGLAEARKARSAQERAAYVGAAGKGAGAWIA